MTHKILAKHYFLDSLDLFHRFRAHWEEQPRKSSRVKSFVDLLMACECMLKSKCFMAKQHIPLIEAYKEIKTLGHNIERLATVANQTFPSEVNVRACQYFGEFSVGLRYSVDAHEYFFPMGKPTQSGRRPYSDTLGDTAWIKSASSTVEELIQWGKESFNGEVGDDIEAILNEGMELEAAIQPRQSRRLKRSKADT